MHRSSPASKDKGKEHIEVINRHDILGCLILATQVLREHLWHDYRNVSAIYCPYTTLEFRDRSQHSQQTWCPIHQCTLAIHF
jgi:hypothetical protein